MSYDQQERTRKSLMDDFEYAFKVQFDNGNLSVSKELVNGKENYADHCTHLTWNAWLSSYETYAGIVIP